MMTFPGKSLKKQTIKLFLGDKILKFMYNRNKMLNFKINVVFKFNLTWQMYLIRNKMFCLQCFKCVSSNFNNIQQQQYSYNKYTCQTRNKDPLLDLTVHFEVFRKQSIQAVRNMNGYRTFSLIH